ncbi:MAG: hypothetical protein AB7U34_08200 [Novosphingobium sp.]
MSHETPAHPVSVPRVRRRRTTGEKLRDALCALTSGLGQIESHKERNWASITFAGTRHSIVMTFEGCEAVDAGEHFIDALPEHEFAIPGQLVADAAIVAVDHALGPAPRMVVTCDVLMLDES